MLLPHGPYLATLESRRTIAVVGNQLTQARPCIELTANISAGPYARTPVTFKVFGTAIANRAKALVQGQVLRIHVTQHALDDGRLVNRVVGFEPFGQLSAVELLHNSDGAEATSSSLPQISDLANSRQPPALLLDRLRATLAGTVANSHPAAAGSSEPPPAIPPTDWAECRERYQLGFWSNRKRSLRTIVPHEEFLLLLAVADQAIPELVNCEGYLSVFQYSSDLATYQEASPEKSIAGFCGPAWARWLAIDLDGDGSPESLDRTLRDAHTFVTTLVSLGFPKHQVLVFFSGNRGVHVLFPSTALAAVPTSGFERAAGAACRAIAMIAGVDIDMSLYDRLKPLRAPNTRHDQTGLYKVLIQHDELPTITGNALRELAIKPRPFELPGWEMEPVPILVELWGWACQTKPAYARPVEGDAGQKTAVGEKRIFASTLDLIVHGTPEGTRGTRFFQASMNLLDFECPEGLLIALLEPAATLSNYALGELMSQIKGAMKAHARSLDGKTT